MKSSGVAEPTWSVGELAERFGLETHVLRYWEDVGLLAPARDGAGRRRYGSDDVVRVATILSSKVAGMSLEQIQVLLDAGGHDTGAAERHRVLADHLAELDRRQAEIDRSRHMTEHAPAVPRARAGPRRRDPHLARRAPRAARARRPRGGGRVTARATPRELGVVVGDLPTGASNALTDVPGVRVGHTTLHAGERLHTGVTAVVPDSLGAGPGRRRALPCGLFVGNGFGKLVGATQLEQLGELETPVVLTATLSAFRAADALVTHVLAQPGHEETRTLNPVVGETNDGFLSDIRARPITEAHVLAALGGATSGPVAQGCVGAGAGTCALGYKGGIGTSSRRVDVAGETRTVGALVQSNFSGTLTVRGVPLPAAELLADLADLADLAEPGGTGEVLDGNSCMIVVATDAPLDARRLERVARRAVFAMSRVGSDFAQGSGDYAIAFTTADPGAPVVPDDALDPVFRAVMDAVEEALLASVFTATTTVGHRGTQRGLPVDRALERLRAAGVATTRSDRRG